MLSTNHLNTDFCISCHNKNARTCSDMNCTYNFPVATTNTSQWMNLTVSETAGKVKGTQKGTCLGCTKSQRSQTGTHSGPWHDGMAQCCVHTADTTGCSGARRNPESRLQPAERGRRGEGISWQCWMEQEVYNNERGHDKSDQGSTEKSRQEELKQKRQGETAKGGRKQKSQSLL